MTTINRINYAIRKKVKSFAQKSHGILVLTGIDSSSKEELARFVEKELKKAKRKGVFLSSTTVENSIGIFENEESSWNFSSFDQVEYLVIDANICKLDDLGKTLPTISKLIPKFSQSKLIVLTAQPQRMVNDPPFYHEIFKDAVVSEIKIPYTPKDTRKEFAQNILNSMKTISFFNNKKKEYRILHNYIDE